MEPEELGVKVIEVIENDDGSATLILDLSSAAAHHFIDLGIQTALHKALTDLEKSETD